MIVLFLGDKPSKRMRPEAGAFQGAACENRLYEWINYLTREIYLVKNQIDYNDSQLRYICQDMHVVTLGAIASKRLDYLKIVHFKLPHPSGLNRQINGKKFIKSRLDACKQWLKDQKK